MEAKNHATLTEPIEGYFSRNELSILGSHCDDIKKLAQQIAIQLNNTWNLIYVDADHKLKEEVTASPSPFTALYTDKIQYHEYQLKTSPSFPFKNSFYDHGAITLINGNHNIGKNQIVIINPDKEASLLKRKNNLTHVIAFVSEEKYVPAYIKKCISNYADIPLFTWDEMFELANMIKLHLKNQLPPIMGLILAGGLSTRMGEDKSKIVYHTKPQHEHLKAIMLPYCEKIFESCRPNQVNQFETPLEDTFLGLGPMGGILTAFQKNPNTAWLTIACDVPLVNSNTIQLLVDQRNPNKLATCFYNSKTKFPEPLITLWEPKAYPVLLAFLSKGFSCPRKVLINSSIEMLTLEDETALFNANTPEDKFEATKVLSNR